MSERAFDHQLPDRFTITGGQVVPIPHQDLMSACRDVDLAKQDIERAIAAATTGNELRSIARLAREFAQAFEWLDDKAMGKWEGLK